MKRSFFLLVFLVFVACSSSGSGGVSGPAEADIDVTPFRIDTGDKTTVTVLLRNLESEPVIVKVSVPVELFYVTDSAFIVEDGVLIDTGPIENSDGFLGFFFYPSDYSRDGTLELIFEIEAASDLALGSVGVDVDFNDPDISDRTEFDTTAPQFTAQATDDVGVGPEPVATATAA